MRLTDDLIAILTSFSGRLYGMRSHKQKEIAAPIEEELHMPWNPPHRLMAHIVNRVVSLWYTST